MFFYDLMDLIPLDCVYECTASGRVDEVVEKWTKALCLPIDTKNCKACLISAGVEDERLDTEKKIKEYVVWFACCEIKENLCLDGEKLRNTIYSPYWNELISEECQEWAFLNSLKGESDITRELLEKLCENFGTTLYRVLQNDETMFIEWCVEDVYQQAEDMGVEITFNEAKRVIELMNKTYDCNYGMTWEHIESFINDVINERKECKDT